MMRSTTLLGLAPALLLSTAGAVLAQDAGQPTFTLDGSGGVQGFNLPTYDNGLGGGPVSGTMFGGMIGGDFKAKVGETDGWGAIIGIKAFIAFGGVGGASTTTHSTGGTFQGLDVGGGTILLSPAGTLAATSTVTGTSGAFASAATAIGPAYVAGVTPDGSGFEYSVVTSDGTAPNSFSYGGYGSTAGGQFVANGPVDITTSVTRSVFYGGADLTIGLNGAFDPTTNVTVYGGPSIRALGQGNKTTTTFDIAEVPGAGTPFTIPTFSIAVNDNLMSTYLGGILGGNVAFTTDQGITFTLGAEGGVYTVHSSWEAHDTYSTCCGMTGTPQLVSSPSISVDGPSHTADLGSNLAFAVQGNGSASFAVDDNKTVSIGGNLGYLSYVPTVNRVGGVAVFGSGSMITYGITGTFTGHF